MTVRLDHLILPADDRAESAGFLAHILGRPDGIVVEPFVVIALDDGVIVDVMEAPGHRPHLRKAIGNGPGQRPGPSSLV